MAEQSFKKNEHISLTYSLTFDEAYCAFLIVSTRRSSKSRKVISAILLLIAAALVVLYGLHPYNLEYLIMPILTLAVWAAVVFLPSHQAKKGAQAVARAAGTYKLELLKTGMIHLHNGERIALASDKSSRGYETDALFILRPDHMHTFCFPKRAMNAEEIQHTREIMAEHLPQSYTGLRGASINL